MAGGINRRSACACPCARRAVGLSVDVQLLACANQASQTQTHPTHPSLGPTDTHPYCDSKAQHNNPALYPVFGHWHPTHTLPQHPCGHFPHPFGAACRESADGATALVHPLSEMHAYELWEGWTDGAIRARSTRVLQRIDSESLAEEKQKKTTASCSGGGFRVITARRLPVYANLSIRVVVARSLVNVTASSSSA
jgi:hypothetical protein